MKNLFRIAALTLFVALFGITFVSCDLDKGKKEVPQPDMISQSFRIEGVSISRFKSFDVTAWNFLYNPEMYTFSLTGTGSATGNNYSQDVSIQQLEAGSFSMDILPGQYDISYVSEHVVTSLPLPYAFNGYSAGDAEVGDMLDINITDSQTLLGTPIAMTANHEDFMIVIDIPNLMDNAGDEGVAVFYTPTNPNIAEEDQLIYDVAGDFWWGYFDEAHRHPDLELTVKFYDDNTPKTIDLSGCVAGNVYHYITDFGASTTLEIPDMVTQVIIVP